MIDGWHDERDSFDTLYVPFVWVPDGAPQPTEWLAEHPDAFWVPATLVRGGFAFDDAGRDGDDFGQWDGAAPAGEFAEPGTFEEPQRSWSAEDPAISASTAPAISRYDDPVAAYLRVNDMFAQLGIGNAPAPNGSPTAAVPASAWRQPSAPDRGFAQNRLANSTESTAALPRDPAAPVLLTDGQDNAVTVGGDAILRPAGFPPDFFIQRGLADRKIVEGLLRNGDGSGGSPPSPTS